MSHDNKFTELLNTFVGARRAVPLLSQYLALLLKWNRVYNLTAITNPKDMVIKHILDSLAVNPYLYGDRIIDVGTGAGLPGIPLAMVNPEKQFILLDSNGKKIRFLNQVKIELQLTNVAIVHSRVEKYQPKSCFTCVLTRAFSSINDMLLKTCHLCCKDGVFLAMKADCPANELQEIPEGFTIKSVQPLKIPGLNAARNLVIVRMSRTNATHFPG
jgi:16S rRNA (guanine527-N7)-methyltransferase